MTVTKVLREQAGIQYSEVSDKSEADPRDSLLNVLVAGEFKRGRLDKPFKVTRANIRSKLGYDPENLQYQAIEDMLNAGAPFVWVQRINNGFQISCANATNFVYIKNHLIDNGRMEASEILNFAIEVNGIWYNEEGEHLPNWLENNRHIFPADLWTYDNGYFELYVSNEVGEWRIRLKPVREQPQYSDAYYQTPDELDMKNPSQGYEDGIFSFCIVNHNMPS